MPARKHKILEGEEIRLRLVNWGRYLQGGFPRLTLAKSDPVNGNANEDDARLIEFTVVSLSMISYRLDYLMFILKLHYAEGWASDDDRTLDVSRRCGVKRISTRTLYRRVSEAEHILSEWAPDMGTPPPENF